MPKIPKTRELFDTDHSIAKDLLCEYEYPHEVLKEIKNYIKKCVSGLDSSYNEIYENVFVAKDATIWTGATIIGPAVIGHMAEIRPGAFIRGNAVIGNRALVGNSTEIKNSIIFDEAKLPHYNYVGDSIIGFGAHMGAGAIASNLRLDKKEVKLGSGKDKINSNLRKIGVFLGDHAEVGCGCVLCPGTIVGKEAIIYPMMTVSGIIGEKEIVKDRRKEDR